MMFLRLGFLENSMNLDYSIAVNKLSSLSLTILLASIKVVKTGYPCLIFILTS